MVRVKICGITRAADACLAAELGAAAVGFVFWPQSPRFVNPVDAMVIAGQLPERVASIGVFVDPPRDELCRVAELVGLSAVQLHGSESLEFSLGLPYPVVKAVGVRDSLSIDEILALPDELKVLLDADDPIYRGGTGRTIDWSVAAQVSSKREVFLSGGLTPDNVSEAIRIVQPYGVDVSSGVESTPGQKDPDRLRAFFAQVAGNENGADIHGGL